MGYRQMDLESSVMLLFLRMKSVRSQFLGATEILRKATISFVMSVRRSVCPAWNISAPTWRIVMKFDFNICGSVHHAL